MFKEYARLIIKLALVACFLIPNPAFSQEKAAESIDAESIAKMMKEVSALAATFGDKLKVKKIGEVTEGAGKLGDLTLEQYFKYGTMTAQGTSFFLQKGTIPVGEMTAGTTTFTLTKADHEDLVKWLLNEYEKFYKAVVILLADIAEKVKDLPVRLDGVSVELAPFGVGASITVGINYDSPTFKKSK